MPRSVRRSPLRAAGVPVRLKPASGASGARELALEHAHLFPATSTARARGNRENHDVTTAPVPTRRSLEASVSAVASSVDGRRFTFQWSIHDLSVKIGGYASIGGRVGPGNPLQAPWGEGPEPVAAVSEEGTHA